MQCINNIRKVHVSRGLEGPSPIPLASAVATYHDHLGGGPFATNNKIPRPNCQLMVIIFVIVGGTG